MTNPMTPLQGLTDINEYLDTRHHIDKNVTGNINDFGRVVFSAGYDYSTKEILCNLLSGRGLLLPNLQICLSTNLKAMLRVDGIQTQLVKSLSKLDTAFDNYLEHTGISNVLGRLDSALSEVSQIASMINFCGKPITPIPITNSLENAMQSFLGKGKSLIDQIGAMIPDQVGGCLAFDGQDFNLSLFGGGILGDLSNLWDRVKSGQLTSAELDLFDNRINEAITAIDTIIADENNTTSVVEYGGSDFNNNYDIPLNLELGVVHNPSAVGIQGNAAIASQLQSLYDKFAGYPVIDKNGKVYDNIFKLILDDNMIRLLQTPSNPTPTIATREPIYNYCGDIVGYNTVISQQENIYSEGIPPVDSAISANPGFKSNGIDTSPIAQINDVTGTVADLTANAITKSTLLGTDNQITVITTDEINSTTTIGAVIATQPQAEAGLDNTSLMTPLRTAQELTAYVPPYVTSRIATQPQAEAGTDNFTLMTPLGVEKAINAQTPFSIGYNSGEQTITSLGTLSLVHNLGAIPKIITMSLICKVAESDFAIGDHLVVGVNNSDPANTRINRLIPNATTIEVVFSSKTNCFTTTNTAGNLVLLTNANWKLIIDAFV